jgi:peptidyl-prolyl cis-trans isomerase C
MKKLLPLIPLLLIMAVLLLFSCSKQGAENKSYIAKVNGTVITEEMMKEELDSLPEQARAIFMSQGESKELLNMLINQEILYQEAKKKGLDKDKRLQSAIEKFRKISMVKLLLAEEIEGKASVSDGELKNYYDEHKEDFRLNAPGRKENGQIMSFDVVKELVRQRLLSEKQQKVFASYMESLKKNHKIEINEEALGKFSAAEAPTGPPTGAAPEGLAEPESKGPAEEAPAGAGK